MAPGQMRMNHRLQGLLRSRGAGKALSSLKLPREAPDTGSQHLLTVLVGTGALQTHCTRLGINFGYLRFGSDAITHVDRRGELEIHLRRQESPQSTQVSEQAGGEQARYDAVLELGSRCSRFRQYAAG